MISGILFDLDNTLIERDKAASQDATVPVHPALPSQENEAARKIREAMDRHRSR